MYSFFVALAHTMKTKINLIHLYDKMFMLNCLHYIFVQILMNATVLRVKMVPSVKTLKIAISVHVLLDGSQLIVTSVSKHLDL